MIRGMDATTIDPCRYARYCGPAALAAILSPMTCESAARLLLGVQRQRGLITAPGTNPDDIVLALMVVGWQAELFDPATGTRIETAGQCAARAQRAEPRCTMTAPEMHAAVQAVIAASPAKERPILSAHFRRRHSNNLPLCEWMQFGGTWAVVVEDDVAAHWLALRNRAALSDDATLYHDRRVVTALRASTLQG